MCPIQVVQQRLSTKGKSKNPVVVQSTRMDVSDGFQNMWNTEKISPNVGEGMGIPANERTTRGTEQASFSFVHYNAI